MVMRNHPSPKVKVARSKGFVRTLVLALNHVVDSENGKTRFLDEMTALGKAFSLCSTLDEAETYSKEVAFFSAIKATIFKYFSVEQKYAEQERHSLLKQILDNAVVAEGPP
jgi:type I restriction enzyme, R subunit